MQRQRFLVLFLAATIGILALVPATAADEPPPGLSMDARAAFDGYFKFGEWLPVWVNLENSGPDLDAEVRVRLAGSWGTTTFASPVALPTGSRKRLPVYVLPNNYSHQLEVQLVAGGKVIHSQEVPINPRVNLTYMIGLIAPERGSIALLLGAALPGQNRPIELVDVALADLPTRVEGLRSLDCLILNDVDTSSLTPEQRETLESWVHQGGRLIVAGGAGARRTSAGLGESLLPVKLRTEQELDSLSGLATFAGGEPIRVPGPFLVATGDVTEGQTLSSQQGLPLVHERVLGSGSVDWIALDLDASPFNAWSGTTAFWERLLAPGATYPPWLPTDMSARQMQAGSMTYALSNMPAMDLPSVQGLAVLLAIYVLVVGPLNYLFLRWRKRLQWAWITIPLLTLLFAGGAFALGYVLRGSDLILNKLAVIGVHGDGSASIRGYVGLFSPSQRSYEVRMPGSYLLSPLSPDYNPWGPGGLPTSGEMVFLQGDPGQVRGMAVNQWSMQALMVEGNWPSFGQINGDLQLEGTAVTGKVRNDTGYQLVDAVLILGNTFVRLGNLPPGSQAAVKLDLATLTAQQFGPPISYRLFEDQLNKMGPSGPPREAQMKQTLVDSLFQQGGKFGPSAFATWDTGALQGLVLLAWLDEAPPEVQLSNRTPTQRATGLVYAPLSYRLPDESRVSLPPGMMVGTLLEMPQDGGMCGSPGTTGVYIGRGQAVIEFRLPLHGEIEVSQLNLSLRSDGGWWQSPEMAIYDWQASEWSPLGDVTLGTIALAGGDHLVSDDGRIRIQMAYERGGGGGCTFLDLGIDGTRE
ncbi:MAG TPA: hypothetical protein VLC52_04075 [Anaerolineae bacterium]|nr:hypothetical protein [Anaerolineae bacterium]